MANSVSHAALPYPVRGCRFTVLIPYLNNKGEPEDPVAPDTERSIDGAAFADCTEELTVLTGSNGMGYITRSEEHTSELQSRLHLVCRLLREKIRDGVIGIGLILYNASIWSNVVSNFYV